MEKNSGLKNLKDNENNHSILKNNSQITEKDPILNFINENQFHYLGIASGDLPINKIIDKTLPKYDNIHIWTLKQLYCLRSEILSLKSLLDEESNKTHNTFNSTIKLVMRKMEEKEMERPIRRVYLTSDSKSQLFESENIQTEEFSSNMKSVNKSLLSKKSHSQYRNQKIKDLNEPKNITADSIWETTDLFYKPIKSVSIFDRWLIPSKVLIEPFKLNEPLGQHYSEVFNKNQNFLLDPLKSRLKMPQPPFGSQGLKDCNAHIHRRLLSTLLPIYEDNYINNELFNEPKSDYGLDDIQKIQSATLSYNSLKVVESNGLPVASKFGNSRYGKLNFETRLRIELDFLGIIGENKPSIDMNYPIMMDLKDSYYNYKNVIEITNNWRNKIEKFIYNNQKTFLERVKLQNNWDNALQLYLKQENAAKQNLKKSKSTKINPITTSSSQNSDYD